MTRKIALSALVTLMVSLVAVGPAAAAPPKRIAALTPFSANTLADLGVRPVAIGATVGGSDRFSPRLRGVPRLPLSHPNGPSIESLAKFTPDLVLSAPAWRKGAKGMRALGMTVTESEPRSVRAAVAETERIGAIVGRREQAGRLAARSERDIRRATRGIRKRPTVLLVLGVGQSTFAFLENSWGGDVIKRAGGRLLTRGLRASGGYARISDEVVLTRDPDVIIALPHGNPEDIPRLTAYLKSKPGWRQTTAARRGHVFVATGNSLLQPYTDIGRTIRDVRSTYLEN